MLSTTWAIAVAAIWLAAAGLVLVFVHGAEVSRHDGVRITSACSSCGTSRADCLSGTADAPCCAACASRYLHDGGAR